MKRCLVLFICTLFGAVLLGGCHSGAGAPASLTPAEGSTASPPLIPHEVDAADGGDSCQECHRTGENGAPKYPEWHATLVDCRQCHVPQADGVSPFNTSY